MCTILLIGEDSHLLETRAALLADEANIIGKTPKMLTAAWPDGPFDLVILCHSLDDDVRLKVIRSTRQKWPAAKVLQVEPDFGSILPTEADAVTVATPKQLLRAAKGMLAEA